MGKIKRLSKKERRKLLRDRQQEQSKKRNEGSGGGGVLDMSEFEDVPMYELKKKKNEVDILPYIVSTKNHPQGMKIGSEDYKLDVWVHNNIGAKNSRVVCLSETYNKPCPICEDKQGMMDDGLDYDDKKVAALKPKRRCFYNIIDLKDSKKGIQILHQSHFKFEKEVYDKAEYKNPEFIAFADLEEGYTITFRGTPGKFEGREFIEPKDFDFEERDAYDEDVLDEVFPLDAMLKVMTYEEIEALHYGTGDEEEDDSGEEEEEEETSSKHSKRKSKYKSEDKEEDEPDEDEEDDSGEEEEEEDEEEDENDCPDDHIFGTDHGNTEDCENCDEDTFDMCKKVHKKLLKERKKKKGSKPSKDKSKTSSRRRNRNR